jgi:hypothetical protein
MSQLTPQQIASLLQQQGITKEKIPTMTAIAMAESSGRPQAFNPRGLDKSYGLFQVNMYGGLGPARMKQFGLKSEKDLFNPETNVRAAKQILGSQGLGAWSVYKSGKYKEFLPQAQQAVQALGSTQPKSEQKPAEIAAAPAGKTFIFVDDGSEEKLDNSLDFLQNFIQKTPTIQNKLDPVALLTRVFSQAPNYLGD